MYKFIIKIIDFIDKNIVIDICIHDYVLYDIGKNYEFYSCVKCGKDKFIYEKTTPPKQKNQGIGKK